MFKKYFCFAAVAAVLVSCGKEPSVNQNGGTDTVKKTIVINATLGVNTRVDYSPTEDGGYKATFSEKDYLQIWFHKTDGKSAGDVKVAPIDPSTISDDGRSASFKVNYAEMPENVDYVFAGLCYSGCEYSPNGVNLTSQTGLEINALNHCLIAGKCMVADIKAADGKMSVPLKLEHRTSIFKLVLTLPEGADAKPADSLKTASTIAISNANNSFHNNITLAWGTFNGNQTKGGITAKAATVKDNVATSYVTVWAEDDFAGSKITVTTEKGVYSTDFTPTAAISAGKIYTVARTLDLPKENKVVWKNDEAGTIAFASAGGEELSAEGNWLTCKNNVVSWTANTTGSIRNAKLTFKNGSSFEMWQADPKDLVATFAGAYTLTGDVRTPTKGGAATQATTDNQAGVKYGTLGGVTKGSWYDQAWIADGKGDSIDITLEAAEGEHVMCAKGIYENLVMPVDLLIDYEKQTFGMNFVIENKAYLITSGMYKDLGQYAAFATELMEGSNWCLGFGNGGAFNYYGSVDLSTGNIVVKFAKGQKCTAFNTYNVVGILVNRYASESTAGTALIRSQKSAYAAKNLKLSGAAYARVIQNDFTITKK